MVERLARLSVPQINQTEATIECQRKMDLLKATNPEMNRLEKISIENPNVDVEKKVKEVAVQQLMAEKVEEPVLSPRDQVIINLVEKYSDGGYPQRKKFFETGAHEACPYCFQPVSASYAAKMKEDITRLLNNKVESYKSQLRAQRLAEIHVVVPTKTIMAP